MFSCEYCKISINTCFEEHVRTAASDNYNKKRFLGKATGHNDHLHDKYGQSNAKD